MHAAFQHVILSLVSAGFSLAGRFIGQNPVRAFRFFTFGTQPEQRFFIGFFRILGRFFAVFYAAGAVFYAILAVIDLFR